MMVPQIIHQTWKTDQIPPQWNKFVESWLHYHPGWQYKLWTNDDGYEFVRQFYPEFYDTYCGYPYDIQRADAIRYLTVYHYGGIYADLDFECLQSFEGLRDSTEFIIGFEPQAHAHEFEHQQLLCNALFLAQPGSLFLKAVIEFLAKDQRVAVEHVDVLRTTGPIMLQTVYEQINKEGVHAHPSIRFCPFTNGARELSQLAENTGEADRIRQQLVNKGCFAVHHWANSWLENLAGELNNPSPDSIDGFDFHPMSDSQGMDLFNGGRNIAALAAQCRSNPQVVAFNTDGFAKYAISTKAEWTRMHNAKENEGLYVKKSINE